jgi:hypothetical protein
MKSELKKILTEGGYRPGNELSERIYQVIISRRNRALRIRFWSYASAGVIAFAGLVPAFQKLGSDFASSGFGQYFSLVFSGNGALASSGKELLLSLIDSLPVMSIVLCLVLIFMFLGSLRVAMKNSKSPLRAAY